MPELDLENYKTIEEIFMTSDELTIDLTIPLKEKAFREGMEEGLEKGIEKGIEQGIEQGLEQGLEKGVFSTLVKLLERRFGSLSPELLARLEQTRLPTLNRLVDLALETESLDQVEQWIMDNG